MDSKGAGIERNGDGYIEADELFTHVADNVRTWAKQHGYQQTPRKQDNVTGSILTGHHPENRRRDNTISLKLNSARIDRNCEQS